MLDNFDHTITFIYICSISFYWMKLLRIFILSLDITSIWTLSIIDINVNVNRKFAYCVNIYMTLKILKHDHTTISSNLN
jgi:hypothetical protein